MCGIGGFSLSNNSKINPRRLSNALLSELDIRGNQASGYAYQSRTSTGLFKKDVAGAKLNLKGMSRGAKNVILHTRYATHGSTTNMANNHPVQSPDKTISLVHNGVIYNHALVRTELDMKLAEVDTAVVPAILQKYDRNTEKFSMLDGDASVAWLDENDLGTMRVARISHSPLVLAQLKDGSIVFASTENILLNAIKKCGLKAIFLDTVPERTLLTIREGRLDGVEELPQTDDQFVDKSWYDYSGYRSMTAGGRSGGIGYGAKPNVYGTQVRYQSAFGEVSYPSDYDYAGDEYREEIYGDNSYLEEFPTIKGLTFNEYGEYFDLAGQYVGTIEELVQWGYVDLISGQVYDWDDYSSAYVLPHQRKR